MASDEPHRVGTTIPPQDLAHEHTGNPMIVPLWTREPLCAAWSQRSTAMASGLRETLDDNAKRHLHAEAQDTNGASSSVQGWAAPCSTANAYPHATWHAVATKKNTSGKGSAPFRRPCDPRTIRIAVAAWATESKCRTRLTSLRQVRASRSTRVRLFSLSCFSLRRYVFPASRTISEAPAAMSSPSPDLKSDLNEEPRRRLLSLR